MTILERLFRRNTNPSPVLDETLYSQGLAYADPLVFRGYNNFLNKIDKRACMYSDPLISTLTIGWANIATTKTFKFYSSHEIDAQEIMEEWRAWWQENNLDELLKALIPHFCMDGRVLLDPYLTKEENFDYEVYGSFECDTIHWTRNSENEIIHYNVKFVPFPSATGWAWGGSTLKAVAKEYNAGELLHFTRGDWNYGLGRSRIAPVWDPITKLRHGSYADFFRRDMRFIIAVPQGWQKKRIESFASSFDDMMKGTRRMFIYKMDQSEGPEKTPLELPRFGMESLARPAPRPMSQGEAGGELLRDPEWARLLSGTQLTENYFIGNQAGAVTGSEVDLTRDFYTECTEFGLLEPIIKGIINWFVMVGLVPQPPSNYVVKYWKDWEHIEKAAQLVEQEMAQQATSETKGELKQQSALGYNDAVETILFESMRYNRTMPMTPVMSSWIKKIGYDEGSVYMQLQEKTKKGIDTYEYNPKDPESVGDKWIDSGSKGGHWWDKIRDVYSPAFKHGKPPSYLETGYGEDLSFTQSEETREFKMEGEEASGTIGVGTSRAPFPLPSTSQKPSVQMPSYVPFSESTGSAPMSTAPGESHYTPGRVFAPETVTGHKKVGPGAKRTRGKSTIRPSVVPYNPSSISLKNSGPKLNSQAYIKRMAKHIGWEGMSNSTAQKIMALVTINEEFNKSRYNSLVVGNVMDFDILLRYPDAPLGEKACKKAWKKINAHEGELYVYEDLGHGGKRINVGKYKYWWDDKESTNVITYNKEEVFDAVERVLEYLGVTDSEIQLKINEGFAPDLSTEYYCGTEVRDGITYQVDFHNRHGEPVFEGIAVVAKGNCSTPACDYTIVEEVV